MKYEDYPYKRINPIELAKSVDGLAASLSSSSSAEEQCEIISKYNALKVEWVTFKNIAIVNFNRFTNDPKTRGEKEFWNKISPSLDEIDHQFIKVVNESPLKEQLKEKLGSHYFKLIELRLKTFDNEIKDLLIEEEKLIDEYTTLQANAEIEFAGQIHNLSSLVPFLLDKDRGVRKAAFIARYKFYQENERKFDQVFDQLVNVRHEMATQLGFENYISLAYLKMGRSDYGEKEVALYRQQIVEKIVPIAMRLQNKKQKSLGLEQLYIYDTIDFKEGDPHPIGETKDIVNKSLKMYQELSPETGDFFSMMINENLMDLEARPGKSGRGFCEDFPLYGRPYIFSNFNGSAKDVAVLTHETGHAFQSYLSRNQTLFEYLWPSAEACEIHSHAMEYLTWPWMNLFFGSDANKFKYKQLSNDLCFLPFAAQVDHFQHIVYSNPSMTSQERKKHWLELDRTYQPWVHYDDISFLAEGGDWQSVRHLYFAPFYYIDYPLALTCAFQFWAKSQRDPETTWQDYLNLCKLGGSQSFLNLVGSANLRSPFKEGVFEDVANQVVKWLDSMD